MRLSLWGSPRLTTVSARLMESQIWHQLIGSVWGGLSKGTIASARLDVRHFSFSLYTTGAFQAATLVLELRGSESEQVSSYVGSLRGTAWGSSSFFHQLNPHCFLQPEVMGTYLPGSGTLWSCDSSLLRYPAQIFTHHMRVWDQPVQHLRPSDHSVGLWFL